MKLEREQEAAYQDTLRNAMGDSFGVALHALITNDYERVKNALVEAAPDDFLVAQGEARAYKRILKYLKERTLATPKA